MNTSGSIYAETSNTFVKGGLPYKQSLLESLIGDHRESSPYHITFNDTTPYQLLCIQKLNSDDIYKLQTAIQNNFFFEMIIDDLPIQGYIGEAYDSFPTRNQEVFFDVFTHLIFHIGINEDKIVSLKFNADTSRAERIYINNPPYEISFSYSVEFTNSEIVFKDRMRMMYFQNLDSSRQNNKVHWYSIINSLMIMLFLMLVVSTILRKILKKDFFMKQYSKANEAEEVSKISF